MHNLLSDPLIGVRTGGGESYLSLPELLAALSAGRVEGYTRLRAHQCDPWHVFLVQLAASIQARFPSKALPTEPTYWRDGLLDLADGAETAWHLLVEDVTLPAFLQHPWTSWEVEATDFGAKMTKGMPVYRPKATTPDELDVLVTAKNHDVKASRIGSSEPDAWVYALLTLQTTSGFLGQGNYGIVRMNGGFASRPIVAWASSLHPSQRFAAEVNALQKLRSETCRKFNYVQKGVVLTWLTRWNRETYQYFLDQLEPWFIEAARAVRLRALANGSIIALGATSKTRQIGPETIKNGDVGDPWTPINVADKKKKGRSAMTLSAEGFSPQRLADLLFENGFELTPLQHPQPGNDSGWFVASCLVRGQGTTEGFHRIELPIPSRVCMAWSNNSFRQSLGKLAQTLLNDAKDVQKALIAALTIFAEGGPDLADFTRDAVNKWLGKTSKDFSRRWEAIYFPTLWRGADEDHEVVTQVWRQRLVDTAQALLDEAAARLPLISNRLWRARIKANDIWRGVLRKNYLPMPSSAPIADEGAVEEIAP